MAPGASPITRPKPHLYGLQASGRRGIQLQGLMNDEEKAAGTGAESPTAAFLFIGRAAPIHKREQARPCHREVGCGEYGYGHKIRKRAQSAREHSDGPGAPLVCG